MGELPLSRVYPQLAKEWHFVRNGELRLDQLTKGSGRRVWWQCEKGHEWKSVVVSRTGVGRETNGNGCPYCDNQKIWVGDNDLATTHPHLVKEWHPTRNKGLLPTQIGAGSNRKVWWQCKKGHEWRTMVANRTKGTNCPVCNESKGETVINEWLAQHQLTYQSQYKDERCCYRKVLAFDFAVFEENQLVLLIEYDGKQHFEPIQFFGGEKGFKLTQKRDKIKNDFCKKQKIPLLRLPYWEFEQIPERLSQMLEQLGISY